MLNHVILWAYSSIWKAPVTGIRLPVDTLETLQFHPENVIIERDAFDKVMQKVRAGASPSLWHKAQGTGWC